MNWLASLASAGAVTGAYRQVVAIVFFSLSGFSGIGRALFYLVHKPSARTSVQATAARALEQMIPCLLGLSSWLVKAAEWVGEKDCSSSCCVSQNVMIMHQTILRLQRMQSRLVLARAASD